MLIKAKSLIKKTANDLGLTEEEVNDVVDFYYEELRYRMENLSDSRIRVPKLGVFYVSKNKIVESLKKLNHIVETENPETFKEVKILDKKKQLIKQQEKILEKLIEEDKYYESKKNSKGS